MYTKAKAEFKNSKDSLVALTCLASVVDDVDSTLLNVEGLNIASLAPKTRKVASALGSRSYLDLAGIIVPRFALLYVCLSFASRSLRLTLSIWSPWLRKEVIPHSKHAFRQGIIGGL